MDWKGRKRLLATNVLLFAALFLLVTFNKEFLRPALEHTPFLGVLTGCLPNFLAALLISLAAVNGVLTRQPARGRLFAYLSALLVFLVLTVEELRPMWGASTVYDIFDVAASALGSLAAVSIYEIIRRRRVAVEAK